MTKTTAQTKSTPKYCYKGSFNWHGEIYIIHSTSTSLKEAKSNMLSRLGKTLNISIPYISNYFSGEKDNYNIFIVDKKGENVYE